jgi:hypothetical protein
VRAELRTATQPLRDEILGALVRLAQADPTAFGVLASVLLPGLRHRVARYAPCLDRDDALALMTVALYEATIEYDTSARPRFVAGRLLALPTRRLRRAAAQQRSSSTRAGQPTDEIPSGSGIDLPAATILAAAVDAGVLTGAGARLILATRVAGIPLREVARREGLSYEAAKKRRRRAEARWIAWWLPELPHAAPTSNRRGAA